MKRTILSLTIISGLALAACSGNDKPEKDSSIVPSSGPATPSAVIAADSTATPVNAPVKFTTGPVDQKIINNSQTIPASQAASVAIGAGLNPAHGQPGHRCEIAVGAPLNSAPAATSAKPQVQMQTGTGAVAPAVPQVGGSGNAKLNPAHGQPGHDCAVQVGAPLKN